MNTPPKRLTNAQQQELASRHQLGELFVQHGWVAGPVEPDLGEDFLIRIYEDGVSTGLSFLIQLKSTATIPKSDVAKTYVNCRIPVKDLIHWSNSAIPVFIFLWDVKNNDGYWVTVTDAISDLTHRKTNWNDKITVSVRIPRSNGTDKAGLKLIKNIVADIQGPLISKGKEFKIYFAFEAPTTPDGLNAFESLKRHIETGERAEITGEYIKEFRFPDWWKRIYGEVEPNDKSVLILEPGKSPEPVPTRLDIISSDGETLALPYLDFRIIRQGSKEVTLSNEHQPISLQCQITLGKVEQYIKASFSTTGPGVNVQETRELLTLFKICASRAICFLTFLPNKGRIHFRLSSGLNRPHPEFSAIIEKLCRIQQETLCPIAINPDQPFSRTDEETIDQLITIVTTGLYEHKNITLTGSFEKKVGELILDSLRKENPLEFTRISDESYVELLGQKIPLGHVTQKIQGNVQIPIAELENLINKLNTTDNFEIKLVNAQVIEEFSNWLKIRGS